MALKSPRADNLSILCDLLILISQSSIRKPKEFGELIVAFRQKIGKTPWKRTRIYHYWSALRDLQLVSMSNEKIELTNRGVELAKVANFGSLERRELNDVEKRFFRNLLLDYKPFRSYLARFLTKGHSFETYEQLITDGGILIFEKDRVSNSEKLIKASGEPEELSKEKVKEIYWTLKNWCKDLDLIDEIFLEEKMENIRNRHLIFPIKVTADNLPLEKFRLWIDLLINTKKYGTKYIPIPLLMYDFCTSHFVSVKSFHYRLGELYRAYPDEYTLEKISSLYIDERPHRIHMYQNYPRVNDFYRYSLVLR